MAKILLVEDDSGISATVKDWLEKEFHMIEHTADGRDGLDMLRHYQFDLVILDWNLPGMTGVEICREYRQRGGVIPVIMLTGKADINDKVQGLECGADDYLTKPFDLKELSARVKALLRRPTNVTGNQLQAKDLVLDIAARRLTKAGVEVQVGPKEFALMELFMKHPNQVLSTNAILDRVWPSESDATSDSLRTYIKRLRKKIDDGPAESSLIKNLPGQGYRFDV